MSAGYYRSAGDDAMRLDWSHAGVQDPQPCVRCGGNAILRHPITARPCHKTCGDARAAAEQAATEQRLTGRATASRSKSGT